MHDGFRGEALPVLRQEVRAGQKGRCAPEDLFRGVPEDSEGQEQQALSGRESGLLARQVRDDPGVEKGPSRLSEDLATEESRAADDVLAR